MWPSFQAVELPGALLLIGGDCSLVGNLGGRQKWAEKKVSG